MNYSRLGLAALLAVAVAFASVKTQQAPVRGTSLPLLPQTSLADFIAVVKGRLPRAASEGFVEPSQSEREAFTAAMTTALYGGLPIAEMAALNYETILLRDKISGRSYIVFVEKQYNARGLGTYILGARPRRNIILEIPHPLFDIDTPEQGASIFEEMGARAMFISGTHRCANAAVSPCTPAGSSACNGMTRVSDVAHYTQNFFHAAHRATLGLRTPPVVIQLHGNANDSLPDVVLSDGTSRNQDERVLANRLRTALRSFNVSAGSCNSQADGGLALCGGTSVQGRLSNGSTDACTSSAVSSTGLFIHVEQQIDIRREPARLIDALKEVFPVR
jgi:hypothetical protein